jgi:hypothetical protein
VRSGRREPGGARRPRPGRRRRGDRLRRRALLSEEVEVGLAIEGRLDLLREIADAVEQVLVVLAARRERQAA